MAVTRQGVEDFYVTAGRGVRLREVFNLNPSVSLLSLSLFLVNISLYLSLLYFCKKFLFLLNIYIYLNLSFLKSLQTYLFTYNQIIYLHDSSRVFLQNWWGRVVNYLGSSGSVLRNVAR